MNAVALKLVTSDGIALCGRRWTLEQARASVVLVHGFGASSTESKVDALAAALQSVGLGVIAVDSRGHGSSGGEATLGDTERFDVAAAVDAAGPGPVVLVGASMGAIGVLRFLATTDDAASVVGAVTVSCPARWKLPRNTRGLLSALMTYTPPGRWAARRYLGVSLAAPGPRPAPPVDLVPDVGVPLAVLHGRADPFIPATDAELLYDAAHEPKRLDLVDGMGHAFEPEAIAPVVVAVDWVLAQR